MARWIALADEQIMVLHELLDSAIDELDHGRLQLGSQGLSLAARELSSSMARLYGTKEALGPVPIRSEEPDHAPAAGDPDAAAAPG